MLKYRIKPWEELTITDDYMFKLVMRHPKICKRLIDYYTPKKPVVHEKGTTGSQ